MGARNNETDVGVIGSGVSGLAAALTAAEGGAKIIVLERQPSLGGISNLFDGMFAVESEMQRERYIPYSRDDAFKTIMESSHWRANPRLVRAFVDESGPTISWLQNHTVFLGTLGGIKINEKTEVVDKKGRIIPGLYAVGFDAAGMWGDGYSIKNSTGASAGFAINSGRIAGRNALKFIGR